MASIAHGESNVLPPLQNYLEASRRHYDACLSPLDESIALDGVQTDVALHYVKFDPHSNIPKFELLARSLAMHVTQYCLSAQTRKTEREKPGSLADEGELFMMARDFFRKIADSGEVGELLLFFLLEAAIGAPQVVCKMELKTNPKDEVKGADGVHVRWDHAGEHLDVYIGESKLYQDIGSAMSEAMDSIAALYMPDRLDLELRLVTTHFKHLDDELKRSVTAWVNRQSAPEECHMIHACLIGWDWPHYKLLNADPAACHARFETEYRKYCANIGALLKKRFDAYAYRHLSFHFLFIPFASVGDFRQAFYRALLGTTVG